MHKPTSFYRLGLLMLALSISACLPLDITFPGKIEIASLAELDLPFIQITSSDGVSPSRKHCSDDARSTITGSGITRTEDREIGDFSKVILKGMGRIELQQAEKASLTIQTDENILPYLETRITGDQLWLEVVEGVCIRPSDAGITYFVTFEDLDLLQISGAGYVHLDQLQTDLLSIQLDGTGQIDLAGLQVGALETHFNGTGAIQLTGNTGSQFVSLNGVGQYQAAQLASDSAHVKLNGTGDVEVWALSDLRVELNGMGTVRYHGNPQIHYTSSGLSGIERMRAK